MGEPAALGTRVRFSTFLKRDWVVTQRPNIYGSRWRKQWQPVDGPIREGIIVGIRTLSNGERDANDDYINYTAKEHFPAYIVAYDMRRVPVYVRDDDLEFL